MGLTIRSSHKQELSSVYQFIDVLYSLCIYEALRHWSLSCPLLLTPRVREWVCSCRRPLSTSTSTSTLRTVLCRAIYTKLVAIWLATIGRCYYWSHTSGRSVRLYTGECVIDSSTGLWDRAAVSGMKTLYSDQMYQTTLLISLLARVRRQKLWLDWCNCLFLEENGYDRKRIVRANINPNISNNK